MRVVGIRELKAKLSAYLRDVSRGEVFLVTDRDRVVAELRPPGAAAAAPERTREDRLERLIAEGAVSAPRRSREDWTWRPQGAGLPDGTAGRLMDELRDERDGGG